MTTPPAIPPVPTTRLLTVVVGASLAGLGVSAAGPMLDSSTGGLAPSVLAAGAAGAGSVLAAGLAAVFVLASVARQPEANLATGILAFSLVRLFGSLLGAVTAVAALGVERQPFAYAFFVAAMLALVGETLILRRWSSLAPGRGPSPGDRGGSATDGPFDGVLPR